MPTPLTLSQRDVERTIQRIKLSKISHLRSLCKLLALGFGGTKDELIKRALLNLEELKNVDEGVRLAAINELMRRIEENEQLITYNELYNYYKSIGISRAGTPVSSLEGGLHLQDSHPVKDHHINFVQSPFFELMKPVHVSPQACRPKKKRTELNIQFMFNAVEHRLLKKEDPSIRIYLLCGRKMTDGRTSDNIKIEYPSPHYLTVNNEQLDNRKYGGLVNKPGTAKPVDLTEYLLGPPELNKIRISYMDDTYTYYVYLYFVKIIPFETVIQEILDHPKIPKQQAIEIIKKNVEDLSRDDIEMKDILLTLRDSYTYAKINIPIKTKNCKHLECFDLRYFMIQQYESPTWECPRCSEPLDVSDLAVCEYAEEIVNTITEDVDYVRITRNGSWCPYDEKEELALKAKPEQPNQEVKAAETEVKVKLESDVEVNGRHDVVIVLSDEDDDDDDEEEEEERPTAVTIVEEVNDYIETKLLLDEVSNKIKVEGKAREIIDARKNINQQIDESRTEGLAVMQNQPDVPCVHLHQHQQQQPQSLQLQAPRQFFAKSGNGTPLFEVLKMQNSPPVHVVPLPGTQVRTTSTPLASGSINIGTDETSFLNNNPLDHDALVSTEVSNSGATTGQIHAILSNHSRAQNESKMMQLRNNKQQDFVQSGNRRNVLTSDQQNMQQNIQVLTQQQQQQQQPSISLQPLPQEAFAQHPHQHQHQSTALNFFQMSRSIAQARLQVQQSHAQNSSNVENKHSIPQVIEVRHLRVSGTQRIPQNGTTYPQNVPEINNLILSRTPTVNTHSVHHFAPSSPKDHNTKVGNEGISQKEQKIGKYQTARETHHDENVGLTSNDRRHKHENEIDDATDQSLKSLGLLPNRDYNGSTKSKALSTNRSLKNGHFIHEGNISVEMMKRSVGKISNDSTSEPQFNPTGKTSTSAGNAKSKDTFLKHRVDVIGQSSFPDGPQAIQHISANGAEIKEFITRDNTNIFNTNHGQQSSHNTIKVPFTKIPPAVDSKSSTSKQPQSAHDKMQKQYSALFIRSRRPHPAMRMSSEKSVDQAKEHKRVVGDQVGVKTVAAKSLLNEYLRDLNPPIGAIETESHDSVTGESINNGDADIGNLYVEDEEGLSAETDRVNNDPEYPMSPNLETSMLCTEAVFDNTRPFHSSTTTPV